MGRFCWHPITPFFCKCCYVVPQGTASKQLESLHCLQESFDNSFSHKQLSPIDEQAELSDMEAGIPTGMPIASGNTLASSTGVQGLGEGGQPGNTALDTNLPLSSGADLRDKNSVVGVAGLTTA